MKHSQTVNRTRAMLETSNNQNHMTIREIKSIICSGLSFKFSYLQARSADSESTESVRQPGIEPGSQEWESCMIPLHYWRLSKLLLRSLDKGMSVTTNKPAIWQIMIHFTKDILWIHI